ncbi:hypothetical protein QWT69_02720 [Sporosarcina oncorhynchi]|uniref:DUF3899 domain-containing protein n=1 Tax=Sporosarcina oncorhynchi TaxID=3056444 RepID=A0ABZ0L7K8_9BACL|nr:hypothetical protein [Sporosarcina sp. T2O-4]WOV88053.1 hypothetical protein QWT69_02720 [Sporosarcina sp. T2O-4]
MPKLFLIVVMFLTPAILYFTEHQILFWLAIINAASYLIIGLIIPNLIAHSSMVSFKSKLEQMVQDGATDQEIEEAFDEEILIAEEDRMAVPQWLYYLTLFNIVLAVSLLVIGLVV